MAQSQPNGRAAPDYRSIVSSLRVTRCGERFNCDLYASGHLKVSHPRLGFLVETTDRREPRPMAQVERMAAVLLMREWDPVTPVLRSAVEPLQRRAG